MTAPRNKLLVCNCNRTMSLDAARLGAALGTERPPVIHSELCARQIAAYESAVKSGDDLLVACTQEAQLFQSVHEQLQGKGKVGFANIRETAGWSEQKDRATPKIAALLALADLPPPDPVPTVTYESTGELLIVGDATSALDWADRLAEQLSVNVLITSGNAELPLERRYPVHRGSKPAVSGYLGAFEVIWEQDNPLDLALCTRCNACIAACPEQAIDFSYRIDLEKCRAHRQCVAACGEVRAIDFDRRERTRSERFDLVLDLSRQPLIQAHDPPQGYFAPGRDPLMQAEAARRLAVMTGEFEKPKYFVFRESICAHGHAGITGCTRCIDVCSTSAIRSGGDRVEIEPHLCMGCGGCATTCPSGAITYGYPLASELGLRLKTLLNTYAKAGGDKPCVLIHNETDGRDLILKLGRSGKGLPARVLPLPVYHIASCGIDSWLGAIAYGAVQVLVVAAGSEAPEYLQLVRNQMDYAQQVLSALGYGSGHLALIEAADVAAFGAAMDSLREETSAPPAASFNLSNEKRTTLDFIFEHLLRNAPQPQEAIALSAGAPFGELAVDRGKCTLCMACVGACPEGALLDSKEQPQLRFIERNCVQCGLCSKTCPEDAIRLVPRLALTREAKAAAVLHESNAFACVKCGKPFATQQMIDNMVARLGAHSMFREAGALERLKMCADCRVLDLMGHAKHGSIHDLE